MDLDGLRWFAAVELFFSSGYVPRWMVRVLERHPKRDLKLGRIIVLYTQLPCIECIIHQSFVQYIVEVGASMSH